MRATVAKHLKRTADETLLTPASPAGRRRRRALYQWLKEDFQETTHPTPAPGRPRRRRRTWSEVRKANEKRRDDARTRDEG
jgi:glutathione S-transferase